MIVTNIFTNSIEDTVGIDEWSEPIRIDGVDGSAGLNQTTIFFYKSSGNVVSDTPGSIIIYTFATDNTIQALNSWTRTIPPVNGEPCWVRNGVVIGSGASVTIASNDWTSPVKLVEDGEDWFVVLTNESLSFPTDISYAMASKIFDILFI